MAPSGVAQSAGTPWVGVSASIVSVGPDRRATLVDLDGAAAAGQE